MIKNKERAFILANIVYLFFCALSFGLAVFLKENFNASDTTGLILSVIGIYFLFVFLYLTFKADRADKKEADVFKQRMKEREKRLKKKGRR